VNLISGKPRFFHVPQVFGDHVGVIDKPFIFSEMDEATDRAYTQTKVISL
jgi:hypothetical protein